jgi:hypothetical protein
MAEDLGDLPLRRADDGKDICTRREPRTLSGMANPLRKGWKKQEKAAQRLSHSIRELGLLALYSLRL